MSQPNSPLRGKDTGAGTTDDLQIAYANVYARLGWQTKKPVSLLGRAFVVRWNAQNVRVWPISDGRKPTRSGSSHYERRTPKLN